MTSGSRARISEMDVELPSEILPSTRLSAHQHCCPATHPCQKQFLFSPFLFVCAHSKEFVSNQSAHRQLTKVSTRAAADESTVRGFVRPCMYVLTHGQSHFGESSRRSLPQLRGNRKSSAYDRRKASQMRVHILILHCHPGTVGHTVFTRPAIHEGLWETHRRPCRSSLRAFCPCFRHPHYWQSEHHLPMLGPRTNPLHMQSSCPLCGCALRGPSC